MPGTDLGYAATRPSARMQGVASRAPIAGSSLRACYAMSGTDLAHAANRRTGSLPAPRYQPGTNLK
eukprot:1701791-Rhodomonas_salina.1